jgi:Ala-tRNA(Pro) deacylase
MNSKLREFLEKEKVSYQRELHRTAYTAQEVAAEEHVSGDVVAKTVVLRADEHVLLAVLPASARTDLEKVKLLLGAKSVRLASEIELTGLFPDCEVGAMPPFGNLYGLPTYVDTALAKDEEILFNAGTHQETIRMKFADFARLAQPKLLDLARRRAA